MKIDVEGLTAMAMIDNGSNKSFSPGGRSWFST